MHETAQVRACMLSPSSRTDCHELRSKEWQAVRYDCTLKVWVEGDVSGRLCLLSSVGVCGKRFV